MKNFPFLKRSLRWLFCAITFPFFPIKQIQNLLRKKMPEAITLAAFNKILVLRLDLLGDVVMTSGFLRELRHNAPQAWITLVVRKEALDLVRYCPYVNEVLSINMSGSDDFRKIFRHFLNVARIYALGRTLRRRKFQIAINPRSDSDYHFAGFLGVLSGAAYRVGYSNHIYPWKEDYAPGFDALLTHPIDIPGILHETERGFALLKYLSGEIQDRSCEIWTSPDCDAIVNDLLRNSGFIPGDFNICLGIGASAAGRRWPLKNYQELAALLHSRYSAKFILIGGKAEQEINRGQWEDARDYIVDLSGKTTLTQSAKIISRCQLFIGNDSASAHLADAVRVPLVVISRHGKNSPKLNRNSRDIYGPTGRDSVWVQPENIDPKCIKGCSRKEAHCIKRVSVEQVVRAIEELRQATGSR